MAGRTYAFTASSYSALSAMAGVIGGDVGYTTDFGYHWKYDGVSSVWRIDGFFRSTAAGLGALAGVQAGDRVYITDTGQIAYWDGVAGAWAYLS